VAEVLIKGGATLDVPTRAEIAQIVQDQQREMLRGVKWMRLPVMQGTVASSAIKLGDETGAPVGPEQGYAWSITRIVVDGLTTGATPDIVNMYRNSATSQPPLWQFNGNNFGYTFGLGQIVLMSGDALKFVNSGTIAATGLIRATGELVEVPAEMMGKLVMG
jgi:hypothetical protein